MTEVVELRVHGVGGSTPEALLGVPLPNDAVMVSGDAEAAFHARREEPSVEAYVWGGLTSGGIAQTFWIVLLPFTLVNVAGWMYPPAARSRSWIARGSSRVLLALLGVSLSLSYVLWLFALSTLVLLTGSRFRSTPTWLDPTGRVAVCVGAVTVIGGVIYLVTRSRQRRFEAFRGPAGLQPERAPFLRTLVAHQNLERPTLWAEERVALLLLRVHSVAAGLGLAGLGAWVLIRVRETDLLPDLHPLFRLSVIVEVSIGLAILLLFVIFERPTRFRFAGPASIGMVGVALSTGFFSGLWHLVAKQVQGAAPTSAPDPLGELGGAFGAAMLAFLAAVVAWAVWHAGRVPGQKRAMRTEAPPNTARTGSQQNGVSESMVRRAAWIRAFATGPRHADLVLSAGSTAFAVTAILTIGGVELPTRVADLGRAVLYAIVAAAVPLFIYRARRPDTARRIAIVWDVLTFFPRRFHPFAVRPYAERAVPELQGRIAYHREAGRNVVLCAHSQGTVIALAALAQLMSRDDTTDGVAFVTFGSPLVQLHARFFPELFGSTELFPRIRSRLASASFSSCAGWRNFYRRTDYVGQQLFACTEAAGCDEELPDPPHGPSMARKRLRIPLTAAVDPPPPAWVATTVHSHYLGERHLRRWVDRLKKEFG